MSLIAKIQQQSLLQNKLLAQLAEMSYQAVNGTRQAPRNFREGTLEIGKMHFTTPQDRITKEMIMDYQKSEQEKHSNQEDSLGNKLLYEPTGLSDVIDVYKPIIDGPITGAASTEDDVRTYEADLLQLHYELDALKEKLKNKNKEYLDKIAEYNAKVDEVNATLEESRTAQKNLINLKKELKETEDKILAHNASLTSGATPSNKFTKSLNWLTSKETKLSNDVVDAELLYNTTIPDKLAVKRAELTPLQAEYPKLLAERGDIQKVEIVQKENEIRKKETEIGQIKKNIIENKDEIQKVNNNNKDITRKYTETFNMANRDRYSVQQDPNEGDQEYINRIKTIEKNTYDPNIFQEKAFNEGNLKLMSNLRNSLRDEVKISEIVKSFNAEEVFIINTNWNTIQEQLEIKFGINNPNKTVNSYVAEIRDIVDKLQNKQYGTILSAVSTVSTKLASATAPTSVYDIPHTDSTPSDFVINVENNSLYIGNKKRKKAIWVKIGHLNRDFIMFSNTTNAVDQFRTFKYTLTGNFSFKRIMEILGLNLDDDIRLQLFGPYGHGFVAQDMFNYLKTTHGLKIETGKKFEEDHETMYGWGLNKEAITKHAKFGKNIILLDKLCYKNILSIKDKKMHSVEHLPNVKVSDTLADIIINMCKNEYPTKQTLDTLSSSEKQLFDLLLYVSGLRKSKQVNKTENTSAKDANIKELKQRFKIVEAEIQEGNNNPVVKAELKEIINKLVLYHVISQNNGKKYLQQF